MWLRAQAANQNLKRNAQTQDDHGMQAFSCVMYDTVRGYTSTQMLLVGGSEHRAPALLLRLLPRNMQHFQVKTV